MKACANSEEEVSENTLLTKSKGESSETKKQVALMKLPFENQVFSYSKVIYTATTMAIF